jgi:cell division protein FtsQ
MTNWKLALNKRQWMVALLLVLLVAVAIFWSSISSTAKNRIVESMDIVILPENQALFLNQTIISDSVQTIIGNPSGRSANDINIQKLEARLNKIPAVRKAEVYIALDGVLKIKIEERTPVVLVQNALQQEFYLDSQGVIIPNTSSKFCDVLVANGNIKNVMASGKIIGGETAKNIVAVAKFIAADSLWNAQFQQLYVDNYNDLILIPRIGKHSIVVGNGANLPQKFGNLRLFYDQGLKSTGWDRYKSVDISNLNQVVGTRNGQESIQKEENKSNKNNTR